MPLSESIREFWFEIRRQKIGIAGLVLLVILIGLVVLFPVIANPADVEHWYDNEYWQERMLPKLAPPVWANALDPKPYPVTHDIPDNNIKITIKKYNLMTFDGYVKYMNETGKTQQIIKQFREKYNVNLTWSQLQQILQALWQKHVQQGQIGEVIYANLTYIFDLNSGKPPKDVLFRLRLNFGHILYNDLKQGVGVYIKRPDNITISLIPGYNYPTNPYDINQYAELGKKEILDLLKIPYTYIKVGNETRAFIKNDTDWFFILTEYASAARNYQQGLGIIQVLKPITSKAGVNLVPGQLVDFMKITFSKATPEIISGEPGVLKGTYKAEFLFLLRIKPNDVGKVNISITPVKARIMGAYGLLGTDNKARDLWSALTYGVRWALLIGLLTAFGAVMIGVIYGMTSGYSGGFTDVAMQRVAQVVYSLPVLPLLILLSYFVSRSIWILIVLLIAFGWVGLQFTVRSMVLQIREEPYIEAARALGASNLRILFKYVFPQLLPYAFASMALSVPGAILTEAGLSFLGLGDPDIVTWGKILYEANLGGAVLANAWWWVLPPGLMIAVTALTFVMIGMALERIVEPRLRTR
ncbi:ABC transporter permease [Staphylothermus hellenicus]|uniref:Binding-protein-dependent transport systems inner membrane component n=1 Tax=Staphylothermus hellenicus (strain DSM 12710 / JCM 10830 / BK20S6-10-b1 / P8) TaxID=591019 RepID=D7D8X0_STAHD|nr:ABC transporter permease [Staphylothermus hellenicus]ADI32216.1 binding-protein-dependent transport systems inner membrane component [Staphylothermus hellenicus DSM 12710]